MLGRSTKDPFFRMELKMTGVKLLISDQRGVYIPHSFCKDFTSWKEINPEDVELCLRGPTEESYWDAWSDILDNAKFDEGGYTWKLYQDGDLFALCEDLMTDEERENFGFESDHDGQPDEAQEWADFDPDC